MKNLSIKRKYVTPYFTYWSKTQDVLVVSGGGKEGSFIGEVDQFTGLFG